MQKLERKDVEGALAKFRKRMEAAEIASKIDGLSEECSVMISLVDEMSETILNTVDLINATRDCVYKETMVGMASMMTTILHSVSLGPGAVTEMSSNMISAVESIEDGYRQNRGTPGLMTFNRFKKKFENYPDELRPAIMMAESTLSRIDDPTETQVIESLTDAMKTLKVEGFTDVGLTSKRSNKTLH